MEKWNLGGFEHLIAAIWYGLLFLGTMIIAFIVPICLVIITLVLLGVI